MQKVRRYKMIFNRKYLKIWLPFVIIVAIMIGSFLFIKEYRIDFQDQLPMKVEYEENDRKPEDIAYHFWMDLVSPYKEPDTWYFSRLDQVAYDSFQLLAGDQDEFAMAVTFWVAPLSKKWSAFDNWGEKEEDGTIQTIQWTMRIKKTGEQEYTLISLAETTKDIAGLKPVEDHYQQEAGIAVPNKDQSYKIEKEQLSVTYDSGNHWIDVPVELDRLFNGADSHSMDSLIEGSYVITPKKTAFLFVDTQTNTGETWSGTVEVKILQTTNKGETWEEQVISNDLPSVRFRKVDFVSDTVGYVILTGDKTMSWEAHMIYQTRDGGETWQQMASIPDMSRLVTDGGFINEELGFLSFGILNEMDKAPRPQLFRTGDGGKSWKEATIPIPAEYQEIFVEAQIPIFDGSQGTLLVNQGPNGDFQGGKVMARFISLDKGETWNFANLVDPDGVIAE